jgi:multisubunit Na+/H+ antiporter MnhE subunit
MAMLILTHVSIALASVIFTSYLLVSPVLSRFKYAYTLIASTLISGTVLVVSTHSNLLRACTTGIAYLAVVSLGIALARKRVAVRVKSDI